MSDQFQRQKPEAFGREIVLANDPFGAFWRPLRKLAMAAPAEVQGFKGSRDQGAEAKADGIIVTGENEPAAEPYQMNGSTAVIPILGPITKYPNWFDEMCGWTFTLRIQAAIAKALDDGAVEKIILLIDSPGGMFAGTPDLGEFIAEAKNRKPIVAYVSDLCCSGAYWLASQCTAIVANESAFIGSIGVYAVLVDQSKVAEKFGVSLVLVSNGEYKGINEPGLPVGEKAVAEMQRVVDSSAQLFHAAVGRGRLLSPDVVIQLADGRVHVAGEALGLGLIDAIGTMDAAIDFGGQEMSTPITGGGKPNPKQTKAADAGTEGAEGGESSSPDVAEVCGKILDAVNALTEMVKKIVPADGDKGKDADEGGPEDAGSKALAADRARLKAINDACPGREKFAMEQFLAGKTAVEAQAALAGVLAKELEAAQRKIAAGEDGADPISGAQIAGGGVRALTEADETDPEKIWAKNVNGVQTTYRKNKNYFLVAFKNGVTPAQLKAKAAEAA
jgi:signal peptide peptidase SppA